jgi:hypothetical protein
MVVRQQQQQQQQQQHDQYYKNRLQMTEMHKMLAPPIEEYNELRSFVFTSLPYKTANLQLKNCISAELVSLVVPNNEPTVGQPDAFVEIKLRASPVFVRATFQYGDYDIVSLLTAIQTSVSALGFASFLASFDYTTIKVSFTMSGEFNMKLPPRLAYMLGFPTTNLPSFSATIAAPNRVELSGARTVRVLTTEFGGPDGHFNNIMKEIVLTSSLSSWENQLDPVLTSRTFHSARNVGCINFDMEIWQPVPSEEPVFRRLELNGAAVHLTISMRCLRYSLRQIVSHELEAV